MSYENAAVIEKNLIELSEVFQEQIAMKNYDMARYTLRGMRFHANACKLRLIGALMATSRKAGLKAGLEKMEQNAAKAITEVIEREAYTQRQAMLAKAFGNLGHVAKFGTRFMGVAGAVLLAKDLYGGGMAMADSMAEKMLLNRMAQYGDYMDEQEAAGRVAEIKTYNQWLATEYFPGQQENRSKFFQHMKTLFPHTLPV